MFLLLTDERDCLRSQVATLKTGHGQRRKYLPYVTEHRANIAAIGLHSARGGEVSVYLVWTSVHLREANTQQADLTKRLIELEMKTEGLELSHDTFSRNTRNQLKQVFEAMRELMTPPEPPKGATSAGRKKNGT